MPVLPLCHHLIAAIPVLLPAIILPSGVVVWGLYDRRLARAEQTAEQRRAGSSAQPPASPDGPTPASFG